MADEVISRRGGTKGRTRLLCKQEKKNLKKVMMMWTGGRGYAMNKRRNTKESKNRLYTEDEEKDEDDEMDESLKRV